MCTARKKNITKNAEEMRKRENTKKKGKKSRKKLNTYHSKSNMKGWMKKSFIFFFIH